MMLRVVAEELGQELDVPSVFKPKQTACLQCLIDYWSLEHVTINHEWNGNLMPTIFKSYELIASVNESTVRTIRSAL
jgi:hypothetical protein